MQVRRVVTGHDANGRSVFVSDEGVEPTTVSLMPGMEIHRVWGADETLTFPDDGSQPKYHDYFPPVDGFRFVTYTLPPDSTPRPTDIDPVAAMTEFQERLPGMTAHMELDNPGM